MLIPEEKNTVGANCNLPVQTEKKQTPTEVYRQGAKTILTQEQIVQMLENEELSYHSLDVLINDFLFVYTNEDQNYENVLDVVFMNYIKERPFASMFENKLEHFFETYHFFTMLCRNRELLVQIATDKGIVFNPKN